MKNSNKEVTHFTGTFLIDAPASFLNGAGLGSGEDKNVTTVKKYWNDGLKKYDPYVSAQSFRRALRDTLIDLTGWPSSEIKAIKVNVRGNTSKISGECDPVNFPEDDIFGYMRTEPKLKKEKTKKAEDTNGEQIEEDADAVVAETKEEIQVKGLQRTSPLSSTILRSIREGKTISTDEGWMHPAVGTPLPSSTEFYNTTLQGVFALDYS
jgi:CRISPR-associated protein Cst2